MAEQTPAAFAAWKGRSWRQQESTEDTPETADVAPGIAVSDLVSMLAILIGFMCGAVGMAALLGWPGLLIAVWVTAVPVGYLLGVGD